MSDVESQARWSGSAPQVVKLGDSSVWSAQRSRLLAQRLRPHATGFATEEEYPLLFGPQASGESWGVVIADRLVAHLNCLERQLVATQDDSQSGRLLLVGNVCSALGWEGQGLQTRLFGQLLTRARAASVRAVVLWSEHLGLFARLGFRPTGWEKLWKIIVPANWDHPQFSVILLPQQDFAKKKNILQQAMAQRPAVRTTLARSREEMAQLLSIPDTYCFCALDDRQHLRAFAVLGRGADFCGVIHEWGLHQPEALQAIFHHIVKQTGWSHLTVLTADILPQPHARFFAPFAFETRPHALISKLDPSWDPTGFFVWGLDSI